MTSWRNCRIWMKILLWKSLFLWNGKYGEDGWMANNAQMRVHQLLTHWINIEFRPQVYNQIVDTIVSSIERRFDTSTTSAFYADLSLLHPKNLGEVHWELLIKIWWWYHCWTIMNRSAMLWTAVANTWTIGSRRAYSVKNDNDSDRKQDGTTVNSQVL